MFAAWDQPLVNTEDHAERRRRADNDQPPVADIFDGPGSEKRAFCEGIEKLRPRLARLARRFLWSSHDAEEVAQEALLLAWQRITRLSDPAKRNAWLYRTTINLSMNRLRRKRRQALPNAETLIDRRTDVSQGQQTDELTDRVRMAITQLPARQQAALVLRELEGLAYEQVAAILKARPAAVRVLVHRARETLRKTLLRQWPDSFGPER